MAEVPAFGKQYTWQVSYITHSKIVYSELHHFSTGFTDAVDTNGIRLRITKSAERYQNSYVFLDSNMVLYDMRGKPVWYFPQIPATLSDPGNHRDLKITKQGTITFITVTDAYEVAYDGSLLWKAPNDGKVSGDSEEHYHHEFTRLANGHYMIMGGEQDPVFIKSANAYGSTDSILCIGAEYRDDPQCRELYKHRGFGTLIEYDQRGDVVWKYSTAKYFTGSDLINLKTPNGTIDCKVHDNSFYFDEDANEIYISFRDISRVIKIKYPEGTTVNTYGKRFHSGYFPVDNSGKHLPPLLQPGNGMFCGQHSCRSSKRGYLYLFNNDACHPGVLPKIVVMSQPLSSSDSLKEIWEYQCEVEPEDKKLSGKINFSSGGNVEQLPDGSFFASMTNGYSRVFIVDSAKSILWSAMAEKWNNYTKKWDMSTQYRASIVINNESFERLIWSVK